MLRRIARLESLFRQAAELPEVWLSVGDGYSRNPTTNETITEQEHAQRFPNARSIKLNMGRTLPGLDAIQNSSVGDSGPNAPKIIEGEIDDRPGAQR